MPRPRLYATDAERQAAYRARKGVATLSVVLPEDVAAGLAAYMEREASNGRGRDRSEVIADLLRAQLLRKR